MGSRPSRADASCEAAVIHEQHLLQSRDLLSKDIIELTDKGNACPWCTLKQEIFRKNYATSIGKCYFERFDVIMAAPAPGVALVALDFTVKSDLLLAMDFYWHPRHCLTH